MAEDLAWNGCMIKLLTERYFLNMLLSMAPQVPLPAQGIEGTVARLSLSASR
jgi:hypothetical protein